MIKGEKKKRKKKLKNEKPKGHFLLQNFDFCPCLSKNAIKCDASGKEGMLSHYQMPFGVDWLFHTR